MPRPSPASLLCLLLLVIAAAPAAYAQQSEPQDVARARDAFIEGAALARDMRWGDALARFESSAQLKPHAGTSYNIGICQRALGQYLRARSSFRRALEQNQADGGNALAASMVADTHTFLSEIERVTGVLEITLEPATATVTVDGRPLEPVEPQDGHPTLLVGTLPPGAGRPPPSGTFRLVLDPGMHVLVISRKGYTDIVRREAVVPGARGALSLVLEQLPGTLHVASSEPRAVVTVDDIDVGMAPVTITRPAGRYRVVVRKIGFLTYETQASLSSGERAVLRALLKPDAPGVTERWWFWTAVGAVVVGTAVGTYYASRPEPERPALDGGGLGWAVRVP